MSDPQHTGYSLQKAGTLAVGTTMMIVNVNVSTISLPDTHISFKRCNFFPEVETSLVAVETELFNLIT